jgi:hypothetical protein
MNSKVRVASLFLFLAGVGLLLAGCGGGGEPTANVNGSVTYDGQPVTSGNITFAPLEGTVGKPANGLVQPDGSFTLSTYAEGDGAVVGRHRVLFSPTAPDVEEGEGYEEGEDGGDAGGGGEHDEAETVEELPFSGLVPEQTEVEVTSGDNDITITLVEAAPMPGDPGQ